MWLAFAWMTFSSPDRPTSLSMQVQVPVFKQDCSSKAVPCVNDCSFLCVEQKVSCAGGVCVVDEDVSDIECDTEKGGMLMMTSTPFPKWTCLCTQESIWSGPACNMLNPDVCEHGVFLYRNRNSSLCICPYPYKKIFIRGKWHCLGKPQSNFFPETGAMVNPLVGCSVSSTGDRVCSDI